MKASVSADALRLLVTDDDRELEPAAGRRLLPHGSNRAVAQTERSA